MAYIKRENGVITGVAEIAPPSAEDGWDLATEADAAEIAAFLNPAPLMQPDWGAFRMGMATHPEFRAIVSQFQSFEQITFLQPILTDSVHVPTLAMLWGGLLAQYQITPSAGAIAEWNSIATACHCPLQFNADGLIGEL